MQLITNTSPWLLSLCIWVGLVYAFGLYYFRRNSNSWSPALRWTLGGLRFVTVALLVLLLFKPLLDTTSQRIEKPIVIFALDNSSSIRNTADSNFYMNEFLNQWKQIQTQLGENVEVIPMLFGEKIDLSSNANFKDQETNFSQLQRAIQSQTAGRNLTAVVLASDGLYNKGSNPIYGFKGLLAPIFTVCLGDTTVQRDLAISNVSANKIAFLNNSFPIRIAVDGKKVAGETASVSLSHNGSVIQSQTLSFSSNREFKNVEFNVDATASGIQTYTINVSELPNEYSVRNNSETVYVEVIDGRQKILILASSPHPDIAALNEALRSQKNYEVTVSSLDQFSGNLSDFDALIAYQLPAMGGQGKAQLTLASELKIPTLFVLGGNTDLTQFNQLNTGIIYSGSNGKLTEAKAQMSADFSLFTTQPKFSELVSLLPPLALPFGTLSTPADFQPILNQRIGSVQTTKPLVGFFGNTDRRMAVIFGEGIWRWRIALYQLEESHALFHEFFAQTMQYIGIKENKDKFRVHCKKSFASNEYVQLDAELYNNSFEPLLNQNVQLELTNEKGEKQNHTFSGSSTGYHLNLGFLPPGPYTFVASANSGGENFVKNGSFVVEKQSLEQSTSEANFALLQQLAQETNGKRYNAKQLNELIQELKQRKEITSKSYEERKVRDLIDWSPLLFILLTLLSLEWFIRKWNGGY
jgi:hypothetical protein